MSACAERRRAMSAAAERRGARALRLGISTCPNDTFVFHALLAGRVRPAGLELAIELADVQQLNERLERGELDAAKVSAHAALRAAREWCLLPAGAALGFGVGPLLLAAPGRIHPSERTPGASERVLDGGERAARVLCPGEGTTAHLLYRLFHPRAGAVEQACFADIPPALRRGAADFGVCIHEARFTYQALGLRCVEDLGTTWETRTGLPLPLGGIAARRELGPGVQRSLTEAIRASLDYAREHRAETLATMRAHAQELDEAVIWAHVELYVNAWTRDLGPEGRRALEELGRLARAAGLIEPGVGELAVCG
jgi:1,4-dihydroxy-6-naphthoate synthase